MKKYSEMGKGTKRGLITEAIIGLALAVYMRRSGFLMGKVVGLGIMLAGHFIETGVDRRTSKKNNGWGCDDRVAKRHGVDVVAAEAGQRAAKQTLSSQREEGNSVSAPHAVECVSWRFALAESHGADAADTLIRSHHRIEGGNKFYNSNLHCYAQ